ncbi:citrate synthase [Sciscionella sediminilitoris]|uniref:citrate synthase n=1 Tax=Sciscionella sediminilitoris TaxID=1445613 RepID=UPI0004DF627B|nr:citrate synthase [Sciscionella sp. SE31]
MSTTIDGPIEAPAGLRNVIVTETELGDVRGAEGFYHYRQYPAIELAKSRSFEEVWFLFFEGRLPGEAEEQRFAAELAELRVLPGPVRDALPAIAAAGANPLAGLRTALSMLAPALGMRPVLDIDQEQRTADAMLICAVTPTILAALHRLANGNEPVEPRPDLGTAANWLYMLDGAEPQRRYVEAIESYLVATIDHGFNASTFTARVVASAGADVAAGVVAAISTFSGPRHGGAPDRALASLDEIGTPERIRDWVREQVGAGRRIMGFGHPVYRTEDPRAVMLREIAEGLGGEIVDFAVEVEAQVVAALAELKPGREVHTNVEFYAGVVMDRCGIPRSMFTPTFAVSRVVGWCANILEQSREHAIIRPAARYVGPPPDRA